MGIFETFGNYQLTERLAFGGMAEVFLGTVHGAAGFVKPVVIKRLHPRLSEDADFVQMLIDEARITAQLTHGNICQVLDLGSIDGSYYIAMEFISGEDVRALQDSFMRRRQELPLPAVIYIVSEVLAGLDYAHRKEGPDGTPLGIIHRDISPQNILISYEGEVKIIDFGIAKARLRLVQTQAGVIKGKFRYMAPEQASGEPIDHRVDIFAAGVVLYELLRGSPHAMDLSDTEVLRKMRRAEFEPLQRFRPGLPAELEAVVRRALQRRARDRYASAAEFRSRLLAFLQERNVAYGRTELAALMRESFDEERRRRRSGSFSGEMVKVSSGLSQVPASRSSAPPRSPRSDTEVLTDARRGGDRSQSWTAFAATTASSPGSLLDSDDELSTSEMSLSLQDVMDVVDQASPPLRLPDSEKTLTYTPHPDGSRPAVGEEPDIADALRATVLDTGSRPALPPTVPETRALPDDFLHRQPTGPRVGDSLHRQPTQPRSSRLEAHQLPRQEGPLIGPNSEEVPTLADEGLRRKSAAETTPQRQPGSARRTLLGVLVVVLFGGLLAAVLLLTKNPAPPAERPDGALLPLRGSDSGAAREASLPVSALLRVRSKPPGAAITFCGRPTGLVTPASLPVQPSRTCILELALAGHEPYRMQVTPSTGSRLIVAILRRSRAETPVPRGGEGVLRVTSIQVGTVYVNDRQMGHTPKVEVRLAPGTYVVRVRFPSLGTQSQPQTVKVQAGRTTVAHFDPQP